MIIINFAYLGNRVKITVEGNQVMDKGFEGNETLACLCKLNNSILDKEDRTFKGYYNWCKSCGAFPTKRGRKELFAF